MNNKNYIFKNIIILTVSAFISACSNYVEKNITQLDLNTSFTKFNDSLYLSQRAVCIDCNKKDVYISDYKAGVYVFDKKLKFSNKIASVGKGHGELIAPAMMFADENEITIYSEGSRSFVSFENQIIKKIPTFLPYNKSDLSRFFTVGDTIYNSIINDKNLVSVSIAGNVIRKICPLVEGYDFIKNAPLSERHLLKGEKSFYIIGKGLPIMQEYTFNGEEIRRFDLSSIEALAKVYEKNKNPKSDNSYYVVVNDAYYRNGRIYLLASSFEDEYKSNLLVVIEKKKEGFSHFATYQFKGDVYNTFCVDDNKVCYTINGKTSAIETYILPTE